MKKSIKRNFVFSIILNFFKIALPILMVPYIYRVFNPELMGKIEFSQSIVNFFFIFIGFGVYKYGLREVSSVRGDKCQEKRIINSLIIISSISVFIVSFAYLLYVYLAFDAGMLRNILFINVIWLLSYLFYVEWINEAYENYDFIAKKTIIVKIISVILILILVKSKLDIYLYVSLTALTVLLNNIISFIYIRKKLSFDISSLEYRQHLSPLLSLVFLMNISVLFTQLDRLLLGYYSTPEQVAYYSIAQKMVMIVSTLIMTIITVTTPRLSLYVKNDKIAYQTLLNSVISCIMLIIFPLSFGLALLSKEVVYILGGSEYLPAYTVLIIFSFRLVTNTIESILSNQIMYINNKEKLMMLFVGMAGIINLVLKVFLINDIIGYSLNANTAIFTTFLSEIFIIIFTFFYIKKNLKYKLRFIPNLKYAILAIPFIFIYNYISTIGFNYIYISGLTIVSCSFYYFCMLLLLRDKLLKDLLKRFIFKNA